MTSSAQVRGGLTFREGHYVCEAIHETGLLVAFDLMVCRTDLFYLIWKRPFTQLGKMKQEVNPGLADAESVRKTVSVGCSLVRAALGLYSGSHSSKTSEHVFTGETLL